MRKSYPDTCEVNVITHACSGMSLNLPAIFLFLFIIFCVAIVHFRFMALGKSYPDTCEVNVITHARSGMSLNLPAVFLFLFIIFCVAIVHFRFMALAPLFPQSTQYLFDVRI